MDQDLYEFGNDLQGFIQKKDVGSAERAISRYTETFTHEELTPSDFDRDLLKIFNNSNGLLVCIKGVLFNDQFKNVKVKALELLYTLINNYPTKMESHYVNIIEICMAIIKSTLNISSSEKSKTFQLLSLILEKGAKYFDNERYIKEIYDILYNFFDMIAKQSSAVQGEISAILGLIAKTYPNSVDNIRGLQQKLLMRLHREVNGKKSYNVMEGCLKGITDILEMVELEPNNREILYESLKAFGDLKDVSVKVAHRAALTLFAQHLPLIIDRVYLDADWWHSMLIAWLDTGPDDQKVGIYALDSFYREIGKIFKVKVDEDDNKKYQYFIKYFTRTINYSYKYHEKNTAIPGMGYFAEAAPIQLKNEEQTQLFCLMTSMVENLYILNANPSAEELDNLPQCLQTLSSMICNLSIVMDTEARYLERILILLIRFFPKIMVSKHGSAIDAVILTLHHVYRSKNNWDIFLKNVMYQSILWTCSHRLVYDKNEDEREQDVITYRNFLPLWKALLRLENQTKYEKYNLSHEVRRHISEKIFDEMVLCLFVFIDRLNLTTKEKNLNHAVTDIENSLEAIKSSDFVIFVNIVSFYEDLLPVAEAKFFRPWFHRFVELIIIKSLKNPFISGFYKLLSAGLKLEVVEEDERSKNTSDLLCDFSRTTMQKVQQYKGDLQIACLQFLLNLPITVIKTVLVDLKSALIIAFKIGHGYIPLAEMGVNTLEKLWNALPQQDLEMILPDILPLLDSYLQSRSMSKTSESMGNVKRANKALNKRRILIETEPELFKLQEKILMFVGQLNSSLSLSFVKEEINVEAISWTNTEHLKIILPYDNCRVNLYIDRFAPRIVDLALHSSERRIRVTASEVLHTTVVILLGTTRQMDDGKLKELNHLVKIVAMPIFQLGSDIDSTIQQLFSLLAVQLMHYYSHPRQLDSAHKAIIIEALIEGVTNSSNSSLRDFSGVCIKEFCSWTIKQMSKNDLQNNPQNIKFLIRTINAFSLHSDPFKRLGAAIIFNNIYTLLREETSIFHMFWIELLHSFTINLDTMDNSGFNSGECERQICLALDHLARGFVEKHIDFNKKNKIRRIPTNFPGGTLKEVALWLLKLTASKNPICRKKCMELFCKIAPLVTGSNGNLGNFFSMYVNDIDWIDNLYEQKSIEGAFDFEDFYKSSMWMNSFYCVLDGFNFLIKNRLIYRNYRMQSSKFHGALEQFLNWLQKVNFTTIEREKLKELNTKICDGIIEYSYNILQNDLDFNYITSPPHSTFFSLISHRLFNPHKLGYGVIQWNCTQEDTVMKVIRLIDVKLPNHSTLLLNEINSRIYEQIGTKEFFKGIEFVPLQRLLVENHICLLADTNFGPKLNVNRTDLIKKVFESIVKQDDKQLSTYAIDETAMKFYEYKLNLGLKSPGGIADLIECVYDERRVKIPREYKKVCYGEYFLKKFQIVLLSLIRNFKQLREAISEYRDTHKAFIVVKILQLFDPKTFNERKVLEEVVEISLSLWLKYNAYENPHFMEKRATLELFTYLRKIAGGNALSGFVQIPVGNSIISFLTSIENDTTVLYSVLDLLPWIIGSNDVYNDVLESTFTQLRNKYFTNNSDIDTATVMIKKLVNVALATRSEHIFSFVLNVYATRIINIEELSWEEIADKFTKTVSETKRRSLLEIIFRMSFDTGNFKDDQRYFISKQVLLHLLRLVSYDTFEDFFIEKIPGLISSLDTYLSNEYTSEDVTNRTITLLCVEMIFFRIDIDSIASNTNRIAQTACPDKDNSGNEFCKMILKYLLDVFKENLAFNQELEEVLRKYYCQAYNSLASVISNWKKDVQLYSKLFRREHEGIDVLWSNLLDLDINYEFPVTFDRSPLKGRMFINIRTEFPVHNKEEERVHYIESQNLFNSTLSEDMTEFDLTTSMIRDDILKAGQTDQNALVRITLEKIDLNEHECMGTVCGLIQQLSQDVEIGDQSQLPDHLASIKDTLLDGTINRNVKLFLLKVICNTRYVFKRYSNWFLDPVIQVLNSKLLGNNLNYFTVDLILLILSWAETAIPIENPSGAMDLLEFLIKNIYSERADIFKENLRILKLMVELWKPCITVPYDLLFEQLAKVDIKEKKNAEIQIVAVFLANKLVPWRDNDEDLKKFLKKVCSVLNSDHRSVYQPCAETIGMALNLLSAREESAIPFNNFKEYTEKLLGKLTDCSKFIYCLHGLVLHYPMIADKFLSKVLSQIQSVQGNFKSMIMKIITSRIRVLSERSEFDCIDFKKLLNDNNIEVQLFVFDLMSKAHPYLTPKKLETVLDVCATFVSNSLAVCRLATFDLFASIYRSYKEQGERYQNVVTKTKDVLLNFLIDTETEIQEQVYRFWTNEGDLPTSVTERFSVLLNDFYKEKLEEHFISYSNYFLLDLLKQTAEYDQKIFEYQLYKCDFHEYKLDNDWRKQHASIAPLFAETLSSQATNRGTISTNVLRSTQQSFEFKPTQSALSTFYERSNSSLLFDATPTTSKTEFKDPNIVLNTQYEKRFLNDKSKISRDFATREIKKIVLKQEIRREKVKKREANATIHRTYRYGDYPDIEINLSSIIVPIQALAKYDSQFSRILYTTLFCAVTDKNQDESYLMKMKNGINTAFTKSINFVPNFVGTLLDIALKSRKILIDPRLISTVCANSELYSVGSLLLEEYLIEDVPLCEASTSKRCRFLGLDDNEESLYWIKLAELYKGMDDWDVVRGIFLDKLNCSDKVLEAIEAESCNHWRDAQEAYANILAEDQSELRKDFYYESYFKCFAALSNWEQLSHSIKMTVNDDGDGNVWEKLWDNDWNQEKLLPWFLLSSLYKLTNGGDNEISVYIDETKNDSERMEYLKNNFGDKLAALYLYQEDFDRAKYYLNATITNFLDSWSQLNPIYIQLRSNRILELKNVVDLCTFASKVKTANSNNYSWILNDLINYWERTDEKQLLLLSEINAMYKTLMITILKEKFCTFLTPQEDGRLNKCNFKINLNLTANAVKNNNFYVARKYYMKAKKVQHVSTNLEKLQLALAESRIFVMKAKITEAPDAKLELLLNAWKNINGHEINLTENYREAVKLKEHLFAVSKEVDLLLCKNLDLKDVKSDSLKLLMQNQQGDVIKFGENQLTDCLTTIENVLKNSLATNQENCDCLANAYTKLAYHVQERKSEKELIMFVLRSMKYGSREGRHLFPCILEKDTTYKYKDEFIHEIEDIPIWMFLAWIAQLLANLDNNCIFAISNLVIKIAETYPQSMIYQYRLSKEKFQFKSDDIGIIGQDVIARLDQILFNDFVDVFLDALSSVSFPSNVLRYHVSKLIKLIDSEEDFQKKLKDVLDEFGTQAKIAEVNKRGRIFDVLKTQVEELRKLSKTKFNSKEFQVALKRMSTVLNDMPIKNPNDLLVNYSPWLSKYKLYDLEGKLEIPGQYDGEKRPIPYLHAKINGFSSTVEVFSSLRKPVKLTIIGNDAKEYPFLIKFGEDLRQDQRLQQLFKLMNNSMNSDSDCSRRHLYISTYKVIPLTSTLGMIEWMNNTQVLQTFITGSLKTKQEVQMYDNLLAKYMKFIRKANPRVDDQEAFGYACMKYSRENTIANYRSLVNELPWDILRSAFWKISINSESFFALRHKFGTTYSVLCIAHWLLGVGDRHLENFLICLNSGQAIGIDFGHAFGTGTQIQPVPELVPFRLTPHILNLFQPLNECGVLQETMIYVLRALRNNSHAILATMSVFIKEPSLDWLEYARNAEKNCGSMDAIWYPEKKILHAKKKLEGANPVSIMLEELEDGHKHRSCYSAMVQLVKGGPGENIRARKGDGLTEEEQVKCLIDQATDYNLLGRMWVGWKPWV